MFANISNRKRDEMVKQILESQQNIQNQNLEERSQNIETKREFTKIFEPITEPIKSLTSGIEKQQEAILPLLSDLGVRDTEQLKILPSTETSKDIRAIHLGPLASKYLDSYFNKSGSPAVDKTFGFIREDSNFHIGSKEVKIDKDDIIIDGNTYKGTEGLWELIVSKNPNKIYTDNDYKTYSEIMYKTNAMHQNNDPKNPMPKSSGGVKYKEIIKPIWQKRPSQLTIREVANQEPEKFSTPTASSTSKVITISDNPNELLEKYGLLMTSKKAGNSGARNELVAITDALFKKKIITKEQYEQANLDINS